MGTYRLILAILVALSHMELMLLGYNEGVVAVVSFLIISGYVMTALITKNYWEIKDIPAFYIDRSIRLYPQFLVYFTISCFLIWAFLPAYNHEQTFSYKNLVLSLALAPLDLYMFGITAWDILPPAWSLGLEVFFYAIIPFLIIWKMRTISYVFSLIVFLLAYLGYLHPDIFGYRLLPGVLFIFLSGSFMYKSSKAQKTLLCLTWMSACVGFIAITMGSVPRLPYNAEVTIGLVIGIPLVFALSKLGHYKSDEIFGNISYGVFLSHFVVIRAAEALGYKTFDITTVSTILIISFICSGLSYYFVERPALRLRHAIRYNHTPRNI